jgi:alanine-glyoxylate transaminase/serine-glyoxylate transaminase/serine-pyruvate transaminase
LFVVDTVTSFCGTELRVDDWQIDAAYSGSQKCLSAPPGLSPVTFSNRAVEALENRKTKVQSWFLDLSLVRNYWEGEQRSYHHTAPVSAMFALREAFRIVLEEGLENRWKRHHENHMLLKNELEELGFGFLVEEGYRLPMLNAVTIPEGVDEANIRRKLLDIYNIEIGAGLGKFSGKVWRIGLMGESSSPNHVNMLVSALKELLIK